MMKNMLKKMMVIGIGSMLLIGSSVSANESVHTHRDSNGDHICDDENCKESLFVLDMVIPATCTENGHTDLKCIACGHRMTGEIFPATGHSDTDNDHYCNNIRRGNIICNEKISDCSGGTATCKDRAFCEVCGKPYGDVDSAIHAGGTELRNDKPATCTENGYTGDTYCKGCGTKLLDGTVIPATGHSGGIANCKYKAVCEVCGKPYGDVDPDNHVGDTEIRDARKAICIADGYTGDTYCTSCDTKLLDGTIIPATEHFDTDDHFCDYYCGEQLSKCSGGTATCVSRAICEHCGEEYGGVDSNNHVGELTIQNNKEATCEEDGYSGDTYCESCNNVVETGSELPRLGHIDEDTNHICDRETCGKVLSECTGGEATCKDLAVCEYCGHEYGELNAANHVGDTEIRDAKEATCCEDGYTGDTYCTSCDTKLLDGTVIPALGHIDIPETETETEKQTETETEPITEPVTEKETEKQTEKQTETEKQPETTKQTEAPKPVTPATEKVVETESAYPVAPQTGDDTPFAAVAGLLVGSGAILAGGVAIKRRKK